MTRKFCDRCDSATDELILFVMPGAFLGDTEKRVEVCRRCAIHIRREAEPIAEIVAERER